MTTAIIIVSGLFAFVYGYVAGVRSQLELTRKIMKGWDKSLKEWKVTLAEYKAFSEKVREYFESQQK